jgi:hypothetical protein
MGDLHTAPQEYFAATTASWLGFARNLDVVSTCFAILLIDANEILR